MSYHSSSNTQTPVVVRDSSSEGLVDANIRIGNIRNEIAALEIKLQAMYSVMIDQGIDPKVFDAKIEEIMNNKPANSPVQNDSKPCPKCGRNVKKSGDVPLFGRCLYCGVKVPFYPSFTEEQN